MAAGCDARGNLQPPPPPGKDGRFKMVDGIILKSFSENLGGVHSDSKFVNFEMNSN
jgi:hypothetical protein